MRNFSHINAQSLGHAAKIIKTSPGRVVCIAGGTDLLGTLKDDIHDDYPTTVVNLKTISSLHSIRQEGSRLKIGAGVTLQTLSRDPRVKEQNPALAEAAGMIASPQIRRMGTVAGNLCQEPRCWYYRYPQNGFFCLRKGGKRCYAITGENEIHSIFGAAKIGSSPCETFCPNHNAVPAFLEKMRREQIDEAAEILFATNPLAAITGRVCPHFCQDNCNRREFDQEVSIRNIERTIGDRILDQGRNYFIRSKSNGLNVAVVGAGPAGLTAAFFLSKSGFAVTVFDKNPEPGGLLTYGIPDFRLPRSVVTSLVSHLRRMGIIFKMNEELSRTVSIEEIQSQYKAVFLAPGAERINLTGIPGEELALSGLEFLRSVAEKKADLSAQKVAVIGGGNVALDCARSAVRIGAAEVHLIYRRSQKEMPAYPEEVLEAEREGIRFHFLKAPVRVEPQNNRQLALQLVDMELGKLDESGRASVRPIRNSGGSTVFDTVIIAVGQKLDPGFLQGASLRLNNFGFLSIEQEKRVTSHPGIYAGGDAADKGPATVVEAIDSGRKAAAAIAAALNVEEYKGSAESGNEMIGFDKAALKTTPSVSVRLKETAKRDLESEDAPGLTPELADTESLRCINCGCVDVITSDLAPVLIAGGADIMTTQRTIPADRFFRARVLQNTVLEEGEIITEITLPIHEHNSCRWFHLYKKYRIRKSIDFPRVSIALSLCLQGERVEAMGLVFGAVAPVPLRARSVEQLFTGRSFTSDLIDQACGLAVEETLPLAKNHYKIAILRWHLKDMLVSISTSMEKL